MVENPMKTPKLPKTRKSLGGISSLHRRSLANNRVASTPIEECNDDDAERSSLVASERAVATSTPHSPLRARDSITSSPQKEHFQGCLKLYVENKITKDNAWNLQLIDFMSSMLRRHDARMENLQTASAVVDASARIYSFRVDALHYDALKMAGGLCKAAQSKRGKKEDNDGVQDEGAAGDGPTQPTKKKKKKAKSAIATNPDILNGDFDTNNCIDPFFERLAATPGDVTSSNRAFNATLPIHDTTLALILRTDDIFLEPIKENLPEDIELGDLITLPAKFLPAFTDSDMLCEPFFGFSISNWDPDNEDSTTQQVNNWVEESRLNLSQQALAFDVNAEIEPIPQEEHDDLMDDEPLAGIESEEEADVAVAACVRAVPAPALCRRSDMRPSARDDQRLEYSYCGAIVSAWAGPQHWRLRNNRASKLSHSERTAAVANARQPRTKRQLEFLAGGLAYDHTAPAHDYLPVQAHKITISRKTLATGTTWRENNFRTPIDRGLDETHFRKLYLRQNVVMLKKKEIEESTRESKKDDSVVVTDAHEYDLNNENDMSYCPNVQEDGSWSNEEHAAVAEFSEQRADAIDAADMLEPPTKVAKIYIPYAMRAKKIDMKHLKSTTWKILTAESPPETPKVSHTTFMNIYKTLPTKLSTATRESLSVPLALLSVLHLANEHGLMLESNLEMTDFTIAPLDD